MNLDRIEGRGGKRCQARFGLEPTSIPGNVCCFNGGADSSSDRQASYRQMEPRRGSVCPSMPRDHRESSRQRHDPPGTAPGFVLQEPDHFRSVRQVGSQPGRGKFQHRGVVQNFGSRLRRAAKADVGRQGDACPADCRSSLAVAAVTPASRSSTRRMIPRAVQRQFLLPDLSSLAVILPTSGPLALRIRQFLLEEREELPCGDGERDLG